MADMNNKETISLEEKVTVVLMALTTLVMAVLLFICKGRGGRAAPPGPRGLPVLGYLPFLDKELHRTFNALRATYGDVVGIRFGSWPSVVISGFNVIQEALVDKGDDFSGRPAFTTSRMVNDGRSLVGAIFDDAWKMQHQAVAGAMLMFVTQRTDLIQDVIHAEVDTMIESFKTRGANDKSFCPKKDVKVAVSCVIYQLCFGKLDQSRENPNFLEELEGERKLDEKRAKGRVVDVIPWLRHVLCGKVSQIREVIKDMERRRSARISEHEATFTTNETPRDLADYLIRVGNGDPKLSPPNAADKKRVVDSVDSLKTGHGTVGSVLEWLVLLMAAHPEVQDKVVKEIHDTLGRDRLPTLDDRGKLPFVEATIAEGIRYASPVPLAVQHATTRDTQLQGFDIPKDTVVLVNLNSIHQDEALWGGDAQSFRPERFLVSEDSSGGGGATAKVNRPLVEKLTMFSLGRRKCIGEYLAGMEMFLFFATLMQRVKFSSPPGHKGYSMKGYYSPTRKPNPYQVCVALSH